jgi:hypothetical protein
MSREQARMEREFREREQERIDRDAREAITLPRPPIGEPMEELKNESNFFLDKTIEKNRTKCIGSPSTCEILQQPRPVVCDRYYGSNPPPNLYYRRF